MSTELLNQVKGLYEAWGRGEMDTVLAAVHPNATLVNDVPLPWSGHYTGPQGFAEFFGKLLAVLDTKIEIEELFVSGNDVVQNGRTKGTVRATGTPFDVREIHILRFRDGLVSCFEVLLDTPQMQAAVA